MPDYAVTLVEREKDVEKVVFTNRRTMTGKGGNGVSAPAPLPASAHDDARQIAPGWDVHAIENEWRNWCVDKQFTPR